MSQELGSHVIEVGPVRLSCMAVDSRAALDMAMERWEKSIAGRSIPVEDRAYSFAYWLFRWSGIITGVDLNAPE